MLSSRHPNVNETYFMHEVLSKIHGPPSYASLKNLLNEVKANASSVPSTLAGGRYGHLGFVLTPPVFAMLPGALPWFDPLPPGPFLPPALPVTAAQIEAARDVWRESKATYDIFQATEKALVAQIVQAIDVEFLRPLQDDDSGLFTTQLSQVLTHLFDEYGTITPQDLENKRLSIVQMHYSIMTPIDTVFTAVDDFCKLSAHAGAPLSLPLSLDMVYVILAKEPLLNLDLRTWSRLPAFQRTWASMLTHFRRAHKELRSLPTAGDVFHQQPAYANSAQTIADLVAQRLLDSAAHEILPAEDTPPPLAEANAALVRESNLVAREAALIAQMQQMLATIHRPAGPSRAGRGRGRGRHGTATGRGRNVTPRHYCWSHGACSHTGAQCMYPVAGHITAATFTDMQGGSTRNCFWIPGSTGST
jgi:hypothetical protein